MGKAYFPRKATGRQWRQSLCAAAQAPFQPVPQRKQSFLALIFPQPGSVHLDTILSGFSPSPALGTTKPLIWATSLTPRICMQVASSPAAAAHVAMYPCTELFSLIFPEGKTDALPRTSVPRYKSWALGIGHLIWGCGELHVLHSRAQEAGCLWVLLHSWSSHATLSLSLIFWGSLNPTPQAHQVWCMPNHQLRCEGLVQSVWVYLCLGDAG